jgi:TonB-linked SusC/RagA family outer membrane protein
MQISTADETHYPNLELRMWRLCEPNLKLVMRVCSLFIAFTLITTQVLMATTTRNGQDAKVTLELKGESLESALRKIEKLSPYRFVYRSEEVSQVANLTLAKAERTVDETLSLILTNTPFTYRLMKKNILIVKKGEESASLSGSIEEAFVDINVTGRVTSSDDGSGLPGVSVLVKGSQAGTVTDSEGRYSISVPNASSILVFSFIGYTPAEITVDGRTTIDVSLETDIMQLSEVVVTAFGIAQDKKALVSATQEVNSKEIGYSKEANLVDALNSKVAGVQITRQAGSAGAASSIVIRGLSSISGENQPLFVVDGIPINNSFRTNNREGGVDVSNRAIDINPNDIETINVLKGPAATALYGIQAASGVVIITTKRGARSDGKTVAVNFSSNYSVDKIMKNFPAQMRYAQGDNGIYNTTTFSHFGPPLSTLRYDGTDLNPSDPRGRIVDMNDPTAVADARLTPVNNQDKFYQNGTTWDNNLSLSTGSQNGTFYFSLGNYAQNGIIPDNEFDRTTMKLTAESFVRDNFKITGSVNYVYSTSTRFGRGDNFSDVIQGTIRTPPSFDNSLGYTLPNGTQRAFRNNSPDNPFWTINNNPYNDEVNRILGFLQFNYDPTKWLNIMYRMGTDVASDKRNQQWARGSFGGDGLNGRVLEDTYNDRIVNSDFIATATKTFGDFNVSLMLGHNYFIRSERRQYFDGRNLAIPGLYNISNATDNLVQIQNESLKKTVAGLSRLAVDYKNFLFLELNGRNEWTSTLLNPNNSFFYGSAGLGFVFTDAFQINQGILSYGKIRGSYAEAGRDAPVYSSQTYYERGITSGVWGGTIRFPLAGVGGVELSNLAGNANLRPERNKTFEIGTELKFLNNRIGIDFNYYRTLNVDQIISVTLPGSTGFNNQRVNAGEIENKGIEIIGTAVPVKSQNVEWTISANFTRNRNLVLELPVERIALAGFGNLRPIIKKGEPVSVFYGTGFLRDDAGNMIISDLGFPQKVPVSAENPSGEIRLGNPQPDWMMGVRNTVSFKSYTLTFLWDFRKGGDVANISSNWQRAQGVPDFTYDRGHLVIFEGVKGDGTKNTTPVLISDATYYTNNNGNRDIAERFVEDGSWVRLRDVSLGFTLPKNLVSKLHLRNLDLSIYGRNLLLFTGYSGVDPETNFAGPNTSVGVDAFGTPTTRSYGVSLKASL